MYIGAMALVAVQFLPGLLLAEESVRGGGVAYEYAVMFSFPPVNLIILLALIFYLAILVLYCRKKVRLNSKFQAPNKF